MRLVIFRYVFLLVCSLSVWSVSSQNIFDYQNSRSYADHLFNAKRIDEARKEYHRVIFLNKQDTMAWLQLIKSYQLLDNYQRSLDYIDSAEFIFGGGHLVFGQSRMYSYLKYGKFSEARQSLSRYNFDVEEEVFLTASSFALSGDWHRVNSFTEIPHSTYPVTELRSLSENYMQEPHKSPFLAGLMSGIIPGSGKIYTRRWKDGLFSLLLITASGWQAYRIFDKKGYDNPVGWFFGGMTVGLYAGNIYGSVKSAKIFNETIDDAYKKRADNLLDIYYSKY